jgi:hypothetical protein
VFFPYTKSQKNWKSSEVEIIGREVVCYSSVGNTNVKYEITFS